MSIPHRDHPIRALYLRRFQKRGSGLWASADERDATHLVIEIRHGAGYTTDLTFEWPEQRYQAAALERMLQLAHEHGAATAKAQVRNVLGLR